MTFSFLFSLSFCLLLLLPLFIGCNVRRNKGFPGFWCSVYGDMGFQVWYGMILVGWVRWFGPGVGYQQRLSCG
ncbi:hypothetical protein B0J18DRAFT_46304 [Chaetomium sp. MPI-SDFR-AT-0129]|nr:hypothetical protein B0J18DRAFT_46304 [Chaetomium sp. MPI-SDFR-AT-0129]